MISLLTQNGKTIPSRVPRTSTRERSRSERRTPRRPRRTSDPSKAPLCRCYFLGTCQKGSGCEFKHSKKTQRVVMAVGLTGPGPDPQNQKNVTCRQFMERGSCTFGDRCKFSHDPSTPAKKPNSNSRIATPRNTPKGTPQGTPRGIPRGEASKKTPKDKRPKSPKPT